MYWNFLSFANSSRIGRLIETWDVLKYDLVCDGLRDHRGLIETWDVLKSLFTRTMADMEVAINRSMRCIEMPGNAGKNEQEYRLIETWDVLKFALVPYGLLSVWINRNMRCIEILQYFEVSYLNKKQYFKILHQRLYGISKI